METLFTHLGLGTEGSSFAVGTCGSLVRRPLSRSTCDIRLDLVEILLVLFNTMTDLDFGQIHASHEVTRLVYDHINKTSTTTARITFVATHRHIRRISLGDLVALCLA
jgi:hypothetical protein